MAINANGEKQKISAGIKNLYSDIDEETTTDDNNKTKGKKRNNKLRDFIRKSKKNHSYSIIIGAVIAVVLSIIIIVIIQKYFTSRLIDIQLLTYNNYYDVADITGTVIKDEEVLTAPIAGKVEFLMPDESKIAAGTEVVSITSVDGKTNTVKASIAGILIYETDGYESQLTTDNIDEIDWQSMKLDEGEKNKVKDGDFVDKDTVLCKVVDNMDKIYIIADITQKQLDGAGVEVDNNIKLRWDSEKTNNAYVEDIIGEDDEKIMVLWAQRYPDYAVYKRQVDFELVSQSLSGYVLPKTAIVYKNDVSGIYIVYKETVRWIEVEIEKESEGMVQISGDELTASIQVVMNPGLIKEGSSLI